MRHILVSPFMHAWVDRPVPPEAGTRRASQRSPRCPRPGANWRNKKRQLAANVMPQIWLDTGPAAMRNATQSAAATGKPQVEGLALLEMRQIFCEARLAMPILRPNGAISSDPAATRPTRYWCDNRSRNPSRWDGEQIGQTAPRDDSGHSARLWTRTFRWPGNYAAAFSRSARPA
jgi:hypothetical protein